MTGSGIFKAAVKLPPAQRQAYLDRVCGTNRALRQEIESLLASHQDSDSFLDKPAIHAPVHLGNTAHHQPLTERPGTVIGSYKLLQQIGEGGMGVVYMAEQQVPVQRKVALKVIQPGMDSKQIIARFEAERQALAMMDHINIARVLDAGSTPTGRPYFVMELVHGVPITRFCHDNSLSVRQRLGLFVQVCQAIQHAHQKGIIHRDIKPSNILVTMYDDKPVAKVIDFGIAKAVEQRLTEKTLFTQFGAAVGTFEYMSPEQAEMNALGVDTRSDIYSLGVLLYELLTGTTPLERHRLQQTNSYGEIVRLIKEEEPPTPSKRIGMLGNRLPTISRQRNMDSTRLLRGIRGELDWIVMKCLEKNRSCRYETANGLARDVQRHLADEPVEARPHSTKYHLSKFLRRNRGSVLVTTLVFVVLLLGIVGTTLGLLRAEHARQQTEKAQRDLRRALAEQIAERLESDFKQLEKLGDTVEAALATHNRWDEEHIIALLKPLMQQDERLFGLGLAFRPFHVPRTSHIADPHHLSACVVGLLSTPTCAGPLPALSALYSSGYCVHVYKENGTLVTRHYPSAKYDHRPMDWYKVPLAEGRACWTPIVGYQEEDYDAWGTPLVSYVVPLRRDGERIGVLCVDVSIKDFFAGDRVSSQLHDLKFGNPGYAFIISNSQRTWNGKSNVGKGIIISHPNVDDKRFQYPNGILELKDVDPRFRALARKMVRGEHQQEPDTARDPWKGNESTFLYIPLQSQNWNPEMTLVVVIEERPGK